MLTVTERRDGFVVIGDTTVFVTIARGNNIRVTVDTPRHVRVLRSDRVIRILQDNGFVGKGAVWHKGGKNYSVKEALDECPRDQVDPPGNARSA